MREEVANQVAARRQGAGLSLTELAARVGLSRQALTAIEAGRATPSTAVALRLARELDTTVEQLFSLGAAPLQVVRAPGPPGVRVVLGRVDDAWVAHGLDPRSTAPADGLVDGSGAVEPLVDVLALERTALIAGCAPVLGALAGHVGHPRDGRASWLHASSGVALDLLRAGLVHVAGLHLADRSSPEAHDDLVRAALPGEAVLLVSLVGWRQGLLIAPGNPLGIDCGDLARPGLRIAQRPAGAGAARVLARALGASVVPGGTVVDSHIEAARAVAYGAVDVAVAIEPMAEAFGLSFLPLSEERFELVVPVRHLGHPGVARLLDRLETIGFAREVAGMGAYDLGEVGASRRCPALADTH